MYTYLSSTFVSLLRQVSHVRFSSFHLYFSSWSGIPCTLVSLPCVSLLRQVSYVLLSDFHVCSDRILTFGIRSIRSPAKVGLVVTELLITSPVVCWRGWETPPPPAPRLNCHSLLNHGWVKTSLSVWTAFVDVCLHLVADWFLRH